MKPVIIILFALVTTESIYAQSDSSTVAKSHWYNAFQLRLIPEVFFDRVFPFRNPTLSTIPYGMDHYMYPTKAGFASDFGSTYIHNYCFRIFGLYYKERIGLEFNVYKYGAQIDQQPFKDFLQTKFPNYYRSDLQSRRITTFTFGGVQVGAAYEAKWKGLIVVPKFLLGFAHLRDSGDNWRLKEKGSNQFINYHVEYFDASRHQNSYHLQLRVAKRIHLGKGRTSLEMGLKTEYVLSSKKHWVMQITEEPYGQPVKTEEVEVRTRYQSFAIGVYTALFIKSKHVNL
jgi:hypothetical protein